MTRTCVNHTRIYTIKKENELKNFIENAPAILRLHHSLCEINKQNNCLIFIKIQLTIIQTENRMFKKVMPRSFI